MAAQTKRFKLQYVVQAAAAAVLFTTLDDTNESFSTWLSASQTSCRGSVFRADLQSQRLPPIASRASSPALSTFGSGNIASGVARGSSLQSRHSSPVRLGSGSALSSGGEGGSGLSHLQRSPPLSFAGSLPRQSSVTPPLGPPGPNALEELDSAQVLQVNAGVVSRLPFDTRVNASKKIAS